MASYTKEATCFFLTVGLVSVVAYAAYFHVNESSLTQLTFSRLNTLANFTYHIDLFKSKNSELNAQYDSKLFLYTVSGKPIVWVFWDHNPMPAYIQLSLETIRCHSYNEVHLKLVNATFAKSEMLDAAEEVDWLIPAHQADYFRCSILLKYGGMYMDADTIQLSSVWKLFETLQKYDIYGCNWPPEGAPISITNVGPMRAANLLLRKWKPKADKILKEKHERLKNYSKTHKDYPIGWAEILGSIWVPTMKEMLKNHEISYTYVDGPRTYGQLVVQGFLGDLFEPMSNETAQRVKKLNYSVEYLYYHNSGLSQKLKKMSLLKFLKKRLLFTELIRKSLSQCVAWQKGLYQSDIVNMLNISSFDNFSSF